ncbi:winged helix-turn-helix domain-containing protein [Mycoplasma sp. E35C]|uniref:winged helix-turn-helix domain-containing protein n=1 Tax=Mycoplasma sp. E35C TaxID=2801918 RepID=UPI001CA393C6|nr:winged helix-turn-helix domain-containing protein [Mycoplasma sp. E35C]QZX48887.1 winged helix-turn-helix transcriptional regulator [Mycoplasma sp. E35C]
MHNTVLLYIFLKIQSGQWKPGKRIPSERQLSIKFGISRNLIRRVFATLCAYNVLDNQSKPGYFVHPNYKTGFFINFLDFNEVVSHDYEELYRTPYTQFDINMFKQLSGKEDFLSSSFSKTDQVVYFDQNKQILYVNQVLLNRKLLVYHNSNTMSFKDFSIFADNGQPVVKHKQITMICNDLAPIKSALPNHKIDDCLVTYGVYFNIEDEILAISKIFHLKSDSKISSLDIKLEYKDNQTSLERLTRK